MNKKPDEEVFEGHAGEMREESPWLSSEDLDGRGDVKVEIVCCRKHRNVKFEAGRDVPVAYSIEFKGGKKKLILNSTNRKRIVALYGTNVVEWKGKSVTLYVDKHVKLMGEVVSGIRIR